MTYNYHTHTHRCRHATGTEEEYILRAIEGGIKHMGFSDHFPFVLPDGTQGAARVPVEEAAQYISELKALREKYKDQINIKIGFEMEYYPGYFGEMLKNAINYGAEYLILGQHYTKPEIGGVLHSNRENGSVSRLKEYVSTVTEGIKTGVFTYVAHPDVINFTGDKEIYADQMRKICIESAKCNVPLEINFLGIRLGRNYPDEFFWQIAGEVGCPVTFGLDSHKSIDAFDPESLKTANKLIEKYGINYIGAPHLAELKQGVKIWNLS